VKGVVEIVYLVWTKSMLYSNRIISKSFLGSVS
jgi:hypothetical protein